MSTSRRNWGCLTCRNRKNDLPKDLKCKSCGAERPKQRQVVLLKDGQEVYLCKANTSASIPTVTVFRESPLPQVQLKIVLPIVSNSLTECIVEAITNSNIASHGIAQSPTAQYDTSPESKVFSSNTGSSSTEKKKKTQKKLLENAFIINAPVHTQIDKGRNVEVFSLFDKILDDATKEVYDLRIGRYIHADTLTGSQDEKDNVVQRNYVHFMEREYEGMRKIVTHVIEEKNQEFSINNLLGPHTEVIVREKVPCALCEFVFPKDELLGVITFKSVLNWKASKGVPIDPKDKRATIHNVHNPVRICVFCNQIFDAEFGDVIDDQLSVTSSVETESKIKGALTCSNTVYKKIVKKMIEKQKTAEDRPLSRIRQGLSVAHLRMKADASPGPRASSSDGIRPVSNFLREKYKSVEALLLEKKNYEVDARRINKNMEKIKRQLTDKKDSSRAKGSSNQIQGASPHERKAISQGSSQRPTKGYDKEAARAKVRSKSAQILREREANKVHPSNRNKVFLTSGGSEAGSDMGSVSSKASSRMSVKSASSRSSAGSKASSLGSRRSRNSRGSRGKRSMSADNADGRMMKAQVKGESTNRKLRFTPTKNGSNSNSNSGGYGNSKNNNRGQKLSKQDYGQSSGDSRVVKSRGASRGHELSLDTIVESERNLPKLSNPDKPRRPLLLVIKKVAPTSSSSDAPTGTIHSESDNNAQKAAVVKRIELPVVIPVKPQALPLKAASLDVRTHSGPDRGRDRDHRGGDNHFHKPIRLAPVSTSAASALLHSSSSSSSLAQQSIAQSPSNRSTKSNTSESSKVSKTASKSSKSSKASQKAKRRRERDLHHSSSSTFETKPKTLFFKDPVAISTRSTGNSIDHSKIIKSNAQTLAEKAILNKFLSVSKLGNSNPDYDNGNNNDNNKKNDKNKSFSGPSSDSYYADDDFESDGPLHHIPIVTNNSLEYEDEEVANDFDWDVEDANDKRSRNKSSRGMSAPMAYDEDEDAAHVIETVEEARDGDLDGYDWPNTGEFKGSAYKDDWVLTPPAAGTPVAAASGSTFGVSGNGNRPVSLSRSSSINSSRMHTAIHGGGSSSRGDTADPLRVLSRGSTRSRSQLNTSETKVRARANTPGETHFLEVIKPKSSHASFQNKALFDATQDEMLMEGYNSVDDLKDDLAVLEGQLKSLIDKGVSTSTSRYKTTASRVDFLTDLLSRFSSVSRMGGRDDSEGKMGRSDASQRGLMQTKTSEDASARAGQKKSNNKVVYGVSVKSHPYLRDGAAGSNKKKK